MTRVGPHCALYPRGHDLFPTPHTPAYDSNTQHQRSLVTMKMRVHQKIIKPFQLSTEIRRSVISTNLYSGDPGFESWSSNWVSSQFSSVLSGKYWDNTYFKRNTRFLGLMPEWVPPRLVDLSVLCVFHFADLNWKRFGRKWSRPNRGTIPEFVCRDWENPQKPLGRITGVAAEIRTTHLPNASPQRSR